MKSGRTAATFKVRDQGGLTLCTILFIIFDFCLAVCFLHLCIHTCSSVTSSYPLLFSQQRPRSYHD